MPLTRRHLHLLVALAISFVGTTRIASADPTVDMWQAQKTNFENYASRLRLLPQHRMSQIMQIRNEGKDLVLRTPLDIPIEQQMRVSLDGIPGIGTVALKRDEHAHGLVEPLGFNLAFGNFPEPRQSTNIVVTLDSSSRSLTFSSLVQITNGPVYEVIFTQQKAPTTGATSYVQLMIIRSRILGAAPEQMTVQASDFLSFIREHPAETEQHLRPLFRQLQQEAVFAPDALVAWQVFSDLWRPDPSIARQVDSILPGLNSDDYHARAAAQLRLEQMGRDGAAVLIHLDRRHLTPEQNARVDCALSSYAQLPTKEAARLGTDAGFLLDCLYSDSVELRTAALNRLRTMVGPALQFDVNADPDTRAAAVRELRSQLVPAKP
jgi:hypothetical protein